MLSRSILTAHYPVDKVYIKAHSKFKCRKWCFYKNVDHPWRKARMSDTFLNGDHKITIPVDLWRKISKRANQIIADITWYQNFTLSLTFSDK